MLVHADNDLLCRVEGDAPMGRLMRAHWIPACLSEEVAEPDGAPVRIRLLGEELVAFRDTQRPARRGRRALPASPRVAGARAATRNAACAACTTAGRSTSTATIVERPSEPPASGLGAARRSTGPIRAARPAALSGSGWATRPHRREFEPPAWAPRTGHPHQHRQDARQLQLGAGARRRDRFRAQLEPAFDRHGARDRSTAPARRRSEWLRPSTDKAPRLQVQRTAFGFRYVAIRHPIDERSARTITCASRCSSRRSRCSFRRTLATTCRSSTFRRTTRNTMFYFIAWSDGRRHRPGGMAQVLRRARSASISTRTSAASAPWTTTICRTATR